jgi:hypothetical protein
MLKGKELLEAVKKQTRKAMPVSRFCGRISIIRASGAAQPRRFWLNRTPLLFSGAKLRLRSSASAPNRRVSAKREASAGDHARTFEETLIQGVGH